MGSSNVKRKLAEAEHMIRIREEEIRGLRRQLVEQAAVAAGSVDEQVRTLTEQNARLIALADELGRRARISVHPASTIAVDPIRWADWVDGVPQQPITEAR